MVSAQVVINALTTPGSHGAPTASVGHRAAQTLLADVVRECREQEQSNFRHRGRAKTVRSVPLAQRFANYEEGAQAGAFEHHVPTQPTWAGDLLRVMLTLLLQTMVTRGHMKNMQKRPKQASSVDELHSRHFKNPPPKGLAGWTIMTQDEQFTCLREWLFFKFSMDQDMHRMQAQVPSKRKHRNNAQWDGFEMNDDELTSLVEDVISQYRQAVGLLQQ